MCYKEIVTELLKNFFESECENIQEMIETQSGVKLADSIYDLFIRCNGCGSLNGSRTNSRRKAFETIVENADLVCEIESNIGCFYAGGHRIEKFNEYYENAEAIDVCVCEYVARDLIGEMVKNDLKVFYNGGENHDD